MFYQLPPAGNPVVWQPEADSPAGLRAYLRPFEAFFYDSGAASLAVAVSIAKQHKELDQPEVLLPAYACPELVSAVLFAGARPILVDLEANTPWMDLQQLRQKINQNTIAVIAVHLFGIAERLGSIKQMTTEANCLLIEDSAQAFPLQGDVRYWQGDLVILSFGRGKPISVLGGGAVLASDPLLINRLNQKQLSLLKRSRLQFWIYRLKVFLYNRLLHPRLYFFPASLPWLKLGETRFKPMQSVHAAYIENVLLLDNNNDRYLHNKFSQRQSALKQIVGDSGLDLLQNNCEIDPELDRLIRYPVLLADREQRDRLFEQLESAGLGASKMYQRPLNKIEGLVELFENQGEFPCAEKFAETVLTLPLHSRVGLKDLKRIESILSSAKY